MGIAFVLSKSTTKITAILRLRFRETNMRETTRPTIGLYIVWLDLAPIERRKTHRRDETFGRWGEICRTVADATHAQPVLTKNRNNLKYDLRRFVMQNGIRAVLGNRRGTT